MGSLWIGVALLVHTHAACGRSPAAQDSAADVDAPSIYQPIQGVVVANHGNAITTLAINEGSAVELSVSLALEPSAVIEVAVLSSDSSRLSCAPCALTFTASNYHVPQPISLVAASDDDAEAAALTLTFSFDGVTRSLPVTIADVDTLEILPGQTQLSLLEGTSVALPLRLSAQPMAGTTVTATSSSGKLGVAPVEVEFSGDNWNQEASLLVSALADVDSANESLTLTLAAPGIAAVDVPIAITDSDALNIAVQPQALSLNEGEATSVTVSLTQPPPFAIEVALAASDAARLLISAPTLTFTPENFAVAQEVELTAAHDIDAASNSLSVTLSSPGLASRELPIAVNDDDVLVAVLDEAAPELAEGTSQDMAIALAYQPTAALTFTVTSLAPGKLSLSTQTLSFTPDNWSIPQPLTVIAEQDVDAADEWVTVTVTHPDASPLQFAVPIDDDETLSLQAIDASVVEGAATQMVVTLTAQPVENMILVADVVGPNIALVSFPAGHTFDASNWQTGVVVDIEGASDADALPDDTQLNLTAGDLSLSVAIHVEDDDACTPTNWTATTIDSNGVDVGVAHALAIDPNTQALHVVYNAYNPFQMRYATKPHGGSFSQPVVFDSAGYPGYGVSVVVDNQSVVHTSYRDAASPHRLLYARRESATWTVEAVPANDTFYYETRLRLIEEVPQLTWRGGLGFRHAQRVGGTWNIDNVTHSASNYWTTVVDTTTLGSPVIRLIHYDTSQQALRSALRVDGQWQDTSDLAIPFVARRPAAAMIGERLEVSFYDNTAHDLRWLGHKSGASWTESQIVDAAGNTGEWSKLAIDVFGTTHIIYYDVTNTRLLYVRRAQGGNFSSPVVIADAPAIESGDIAVDGFGGVHVTYHDWPNEDLIYLYSCE